MINSCLLWALITVESAWNPNAISSAGAKGLMQLTPIGVQEVVDRYGLNYRPDLYNPEQNIEWGVLLLTHFISVAGGRIEAALYLYNGGYRQFNAYVEGRPVTRETFLYVPKILTLETDCELDRGYEQRWRVDIDYGLNLP